MSLLAKEDVYPSRVGDQPAILERRDPTVYGHQAGPLSTVQLNDYQDNGFLLWENLFSAAEVAKMRDDLVRIWRQSEDSAAPEVIREPGGDQVRSVFAVHETDAAFNRVSRDPRLLNAARQILNSEVYVHQSRINFKPGFTGQEFYWHSDFETWHVEDGMPRMRALSCSIWLDDNFAFNGSLMVIPHSHHYFVACGGRTPKEHYKQSLRRQEYGVPDRGSLSWLVEHHGIRMPEAKAGAVLLFDCNIMHGSNSNITPLGRRNVFLVYNSVENPLAPPFSGEAPRPSFLAHRNPETVVL